ncbi:MAG: ABC1 kinase family protein [Limisphaerales bacterium]
MNWIQFARLIHSIYGHNRKLPDLDWIERLGLLAVKLGQVHALRIDFLEREKCEHLAKLYRRNAFLPGEEFTELLTASSGRQFLDHFANIEQKALASASVGQVHRARLKSGEEVVIKAVKRDVRAQFQSDVASLKRLFALANFFYPALRRAGDPVGILADIEEYTLSELDLRHEVLGQQTLRRIVEQSAGFYDLSQLKFAHVYHSLCNQNVMVSEFIAGRSFDELLERGELSYELLLELFRVHGFYIFCKGTFHGDLHPGNVLLSDGKLCLIDTGYIGRVSPKIRRGLFAFFLALTEHDYDECAKALNRTAIVELTGIEFEVFSRNVRKLYADFKTSTVAQVSLTRKMMQTMKLGVQCGMKFDRGIFAIIRSLMYLDGMVLRCKPDAVLISDMRPFIQSFDTIMQAEKASHPVAH